jgi:hypothetical protein
MEQQNILLKQKKMCGSEHPMSDVVVCGQKDCCGEISIWKLLAYRVVVAGWRRGSVLGP